MNIVKKLSVPLVLGLLVWGSWTCKDDLTDKGPIDIIFPDSLVRYGTHVQPLFNRGCAFSGCHDADRLAPDGYSLDSYTNLMYGTRAVVFRFDPDASLLIHTVEGKAGVPRMPPASFSQLTPNQIRGLRKWVEEGAQNN